MENGWGFAGLLAPRVSELVCVSWSQESEQLRLKAFLLFGKLAKVVRISKKHFFKEEVKKAWVPLMLHCQDSCSNVAQVRHTLVCVPKPGALTVPKRKMLSGCAGLATRGLSPPNSVSARALQPHIRLGKGAIQGNPQIGLLRSLSSVGAGFPFCPVTACKRPPAISLSSTSFTFRYYDPSMFKTHPKSFFICSLWGRLVRMGRGA